MLYHVADKPAEGLTKTRDAVSISQALVRERPHDQNTRFHLALATVNLGNYAMDSDPDAGIARYREALVLIAALRSEDPGESALHRMGSADHEQPGTDPARDRKDRGRRRSPTPGGRPGRASRRRLLPDRRPGNLPQQPGRSPAASQAPRRGRNHLSPITQGLPDPGGPVPQRRGLPLGHGHDPGQSRGRRAPARPPQGRTHAHRGVGHDLRRLARTHWAPMPSSNDITRNTQASGTRSGGAWRRRAPDLEHEWSVPWDRECGNHRRQT